jgi:hypothetical protein
VKRIFNGEEENDGHRCEIDVAESKSLTAKLDAQHPTVRAQLPAHVRTFIETPPGPGDLPEYSTKSATEGKASATVELGKDEREKLVKEAATESAKRGLATKMKYAIDRNVIVVSTAKVALMDAAVEPSRELQSWTGTEALLDAMGRDDALVRQFQSLADAAQERMRQKELADVAESEKRLAAAASSTPALSPAEQEAKALIERLAVTKAPVTLPKKRAAPIVLVDADDRVYKIGITTMKLDELAKYVAAQAGWLDALRAAATV